MADAKGNQEPSMEEILASIRRIISEGDEPKEEAAAPVANGANGANGHADDDDDDALVLTDMVVGESNVVELKEEAPPQPPLDVAAAPTAPQIPMDEPPAPPAQIAMDEPLTPAMEPEPEPLPEPEPDPEPEEIELAEEEAAPAMSASAPNADDGFSVTPAASPEEGDLVSPDVAAASAATMAQLVARKTSNAVPRQQTLDGLLVETLVRQAVEPMLKEWLDEHLQEIVERLVRREVERLSRKAELS